MREGSILRAEVGGGQVFVVGEEGDLDAGSLDIVDIGAIGTGDAFFLVDIEDRSWRPTY